MKNATEHAKVLKKLLTKLKPQVTIPDEEPLIPIWGMVYAFLVWESSRNQADTAYNKLVDSMVDINDLRVTDPGELVEIIGDNYHLAEERCLRLTRTLHAVYNREHAVELVSAVGMSKRDARAYLDGLEAITPFVAGYVMLFGLGGHAVPIDDQLCERLRNDGVIHEDATLEEAQAFLEHQIRADDAVEAFYLLRAYVERPIKVSLGVRKKTTKKSASKKTTKKKTTKKKSTKTKTTKKSTSKKSTKKKTTKKKTKAK